MTARRQPRAIALLYNEAALLLSVLCVGFPLVWILGPAGIALSNDVTDTALPPGQTSCSPPRFAACPARWTVAGVAQIGGDGQPGSRMAGDILITNGRGA